MSASLRRTLTLSLSAPSLALALCVATPALAQAPPVPQPGPEHEMLKKDVGTWDATVEMFMGPPAARQRSRRAPRR